MAAGNIRADRRYPSMHRSPMEEQIEKKGHFGFETVFRALSELAKGLILFDEKGNVYQADDKAAQQLGYAVDQLKSMSIFQLNPTLSMLQWRNWRKDVISGNNIQSQTRWQGANGTFLTLFHTACPLSDDTNTFIVLQIDRLPVQTLLPLLQSSSRFSRSAAWEWDLKKEQLVVTEHFYTLFELDPAQFEGIELTIFQLLKNRLSPDQMSQLKKSISDLRAGEQQAVLQLDLQWDDTRKSILLQAESVGSQDRIEKIRGFLQVLPSSSAAAGDKAQLLLDNARSMICWISADDRLVYVNQAFSDALGYRREELLRKFDIHRIDIEHSRSNWDRFRQKLEKQSEIVLETSFQRKDGTIFPVEINLIHLQSDMIGLLAQDISFRRQQEAELKAGLLQVNELSRQLEAENLYLQQEVSHHFENIISQSKAYAEVLHQVEQVAPTDSTVLIEGESGTGKELLAHAIHRLSQRSRRALVKVNCAVLPESLIESELFGHERGAFTGADKRRIGRFELADGGTIFLDEIGELPLDVQVKLLRVLQEGEFERLGGNATLSVNVRIIAATNRKLKEMVSRKKFREDLYYRLNVFPIENIPLRKRREDIPLLTRHFLQHFSVKTGKKITKIRPQDMKRLKKYGFPGNVRELENIIERAVILSQGEVLNLSYWKPNSDSHSTEDGEIKSMKQMQYDLIMRTLEKTRWRVSGPDGAAAILDMHPQTLYSRMRKLGIKRDA